MRLAPSGFSLATWPIHWQILRALAVVVADNVLW